MLNTYFKDEADKSKAVTTPQALSPSQIISSGEYEKRIKLKEDFLANLIHDLKSPVFSQIQALKILLNDENLPLNDIQREIINQVLTSNFYMENMIQNVLLKFKNQNTMIDIAKTKNNFKNTIAEAIENISFMFSEKEQRVLLSYNTKTEIAFYDDIEIKRVFTNLLSNAIKYGDSKSIIKVNVEKSGKMLRSSIINTGKHIPDDEIGHIFDIYSTSSKKRKTIGTGLGLYICKQIAEAHKGRIWAKNTALRSVEFSFEIPIK